MTTTMPEHYALVGGSVLAGDDLHLIENGYVEVADGKIAGVGESADVPAVPVVDVPNTLILPGFVNGHTHIEDAGFKELPFGVPSSVNLLFEPDGLRHVRVRETPREQLVGDIRLAVQGMIESGIVAFADYKTDGRDGIEVLREAVDGLPITCLAFAGHSTFPVQSDAVLEENRAGLTSDQLEDISTALEIADGFAPVRVNDTTDAALEQIRDLVRGHGRLLSTHSSASPDYRDLSMQRTGRSDIDRAIDFLDPDFVVHMTEANDEEIERIVAAGIPMVMCPSTMAALGRPVPPYLQARRRGGVIGLGSDNAMTTRPDMLNEVGFLARIARSMAADPCAVDARELIASITRDAAAAIQLGDVLGTLSTGKNAAMVVMDLMTPNMRNSIDPVASVVSRANSGDIKAVLYDGRIAHGSL
jgi:cytosine/adenosine deaminase-related metal-dependent hydrolase